MFFATTLQGRTPTFSISIDGQLHGFFKGARGLRQGDPLSPFLFAICIEMLSRSLKKMAATTGFEFHPYCKQIGITHLAYADDLLLFCKGDTMSIQLMMECVARFGDMAGLKANKLKSNMYLAGMWDSEQAEIIEATGFSAGTIPFRYLGIPISSARLRRSDYKVLIDKIQNKVISWPKNSISYAGKLELIRSILQGIECYWLTILPVPCYVIDKIYTICRRFLWSGKHPSISWDILCKPKEDGGQGLRNLRNWNKALLAKTLWNIHEKKDTLWVKWIHHTYGDNIWTREAKKEDSGLFKKIIDVRNELISDGRTIDKAKVLLTSWFTKNRNVGNAYLFFTPGVRKWPWKPPIWQHSIIPKHRFAFWLFAHKKLLTKDRQPYVLDKLCSLCGEKEETCAHLFFQCAKPRLLWSKVCEWLHIKGRWESANIMLRSFRRHYRGTSKNTKLIFMATAAVVYQIWNMRNIAAFEGKQMDVEVIFRRIQILHTDG